jgi:hypothetical protein
MAPSPAVPNRLASSAQLAAPHVDPLKAEARAHVGDFPDPKVQRRPILRLALAAGCAWFG